MIWVIFTILAVILVFVVVLMFKKNDKDKNGVIPEDLAGISIIAAKINDTVIIPGSGDNYDDLSLTVEQKNRYEADGRQWFELCGRYNGRLISVEVVQDDEAEVSVCLQKPNLRLNQIGLTEESLIRMDENQDCSESFEYDGSLWHFQGSREMFFYKDCSDTAEGYYNWEFSDKDNKKYLFIEKWEQSPFVAGISIRVNPDDISVFRGA